MSKIIGIDLGTTNSLVAVIEGNRPIIIANSFGTNLLNSVVKLEKNGQCIVGNSAYRARVLDPTNTITSIKRYIGRKYNEVFDLALKSSYNIVLGENNLACVEAHDKLYTPQEISAMIIRSLKKSAENYLGTEVTEAIITVPAYFNERQKKATKEAGELAGLKIRRIINEPTAAALAYGLDKANMDIKVAVFDLGGGTFDFSILELGDGVFEVKSISGDGFLGGDDFDHALEKWIVEEVTLHYGINPDGDPISLSVIKDAAARAKFDLSSDESTWIDIPFLPIHGQIITNVSILITRNRFEEICEELFQRLIPPCKLALKNAELSASEINRVILVGGASRMPKISQIIWDIFASLPSKDINPDEAVALGAAIQGGVLEGSVKDILLLDVIPISLGLESANGTMIVMIESNTIIPTKKSEIFSTFTENQSSIEVHILEGENKLAIDNKSLGRLILDNLILLPAGVPKIEVTFDIDANGILHVSAKENTTGRIANVRIEADSGLSPALLLSDLPKSREY
jgi:molecular chaperone DnaK